MVNDLTRRLPKQGRITGNNYYRQPIVGETRFNRVEVAIRMHPNLLEQLNEAWLASDERYFSRFVTDILRDAMLKRALLKEAQK